MKITREQYKKWNAENKNGYKLDLQYYITWGKKENILYKELTDNKRLEVRLCYIPESIIKTNNYGCKWTEKTGNYIPTLYITVWRKSENTSCYIQIQHSKYIPLTDYADIQKNQNYKILQKLTNVITLEKALQIGKENNFEIEQ